MFINDKLARLKGRLPWRVRRRLEKLQLASLRFVQSQSELQVRAGSPSASLVAVGDVALSGGVGTLLERSDAAKYLGDIHALFSDCDLRIGNLETVLTDAGTATGSLGSFHKASPAAVDLLTAARFDVVTLANNHARDCRVAGLLQCREVLRQHGIQHCGAGVSLEQSRSPAIVKMTDLKVGMLGYCDNFRVDAEDAENVAPAPARDDWIVSDICALRPQVDLLILQLHWGWEFSFYPLLSYRDRARRFAEAGADLVLCHHAHLPMGAEVWKSSIIAHGLGNFIFPRGAYVMGGHPWTYRSYVLKVFFNKLGVLRAEIIPFTIDSEGFPRIAIRSSAAETLGGVGRASARLSNDMLLAWVERDRTVRDTLFFFASLQKSDPATAKEWALWVQSLLQQDNIHRLRLNCGAAGERLAVCMQHVAESSVDPQRSAPLPKESRADEIVSALASLRSSNPIPEDIPGRIP